MSFKNWLEAHHFYGGYNPQRHFDPDVSFNPLKRGDTVRVFHGFNNLRDAIRTAKYGLSGRSRASRNYSYEADNNPYGLFVTLNFGTATQFVGAYDDNAVIEFNAQENDLEAPVWPGGGYAVQGQMAQYFGRGPEGKQKRQERRKESGKETEQWLANNPNSNDFIKNSSDPYKARLLMSSSEHQALFVGHLNPDDIVAFHVRSSENGSNEFIRLSKDQFLQRYENYQDKDSQNPPPKDKVFLPNENFDGEKFILRLQQKFGKMLNIESSLERLTQTVLKAQRGDKMNVFINYFDHYLWPKQYADALNFLKNRYKKANPIKG